MNSEINSDAIGAHLLPLDALLERVRFADATAIDILKQRFAGDLYHTLKPRFPYAAGIASIEIFDSLPRLLAKYAEQGKFFSWLATVTASRARSLERDHRHETNRLVTLDLDGPVAMPPFRTPFRTLETEMLRARFVEVLSPDELRLFADLEAGYGTPEMIARHAPGSNANAMYQRVSRLREKLRDRAKELQLYPHLWTRARDGRKGTPEA